MVDDVMVDHVMDHVVMAAMARRHGLRRNRVGAVSRSFGVVGCLYRARRSRLGT